LALTNTTSTIVPGWKRSNIQVLLNKLITTGPSGAGTLGFRNVGNGPWPRQGRSLRSLGLQSTGGVNAMRIVSDRVLATVQRPTFTLELPFTPTAFAFAIVSVLQNRVTASTNINVVPYTSGPAGLFFAMETSFGATAGRAIAGAIAKTVKISIPPAGADGGAPTLTMECIAYSAVQANANVLTGITLDTATPCQSTDWNIKYGVTGTLEAMSHCGFDLTIENNASVDPQVSATPAGFILGDLEISGTVKYVMSTTSTDAFNAIEGDFIAGTVKELQLNWGAAGATAYIQLPLQLEEPGQPEKQGNVMVMSVPFSGYYKDDDEPLVFLANMANTLTLWA
jgi:hypothetical protein